MVKRSNSQKFKVPKDVKVKGSSSQSKGYRVPKIIRSKVPKGQKFLKVKSS